MSKAEIRRRRTSKIGKKGELPNGHHGRSQKGCFGGTPNYRKEQG